MWSNQSVFILRLINYWKILVGAVVGSLALKKPKTTDGMFLQNWHCNSNMNQTKEILTAYFKNISLALYIPCFCLDQYAT